MLNYSEIMKLLEEQMGFYAAYHQDGRNKATHFIGVPAIMLSLFIPLGLAMLAVSATLVWLGQMISDQGAMQMRAQAGVAGAGGSLKSA